MARIALSIQTLADEVHAISPRTTIYFYDDSRELDSDHDANKYGVVCACDIMQGYGLDLGKLAQAIVDSRHPEAKYCLAPESRVLCADLQWRPIGDLRVGDKLIGFDEFTAADRRNAGGRLKTSTIQNVARITLPSVKIRTNRGEVVASADHMWVLYRGRGGRSRWIDSKDLKPGDEIKYFATPWDHEDSRDAGWLAGMFDGEGNLTIRPGAKRSGGSLSVAQKPGPVMDEVQRILADLGISFTVNQNGVVQSARIAGGLPAYLSFLGRISPIRLKSKMIDGELWDGWRVTNSEIAVVESVEPVGTAEVVSVQTSTSTFIAEGMWSHNCIYNKRIASRKTNWQWVAYSGASDHTDHIHVSVGVGSDGHSEPPYDSTASWLEDLMALDGKDVAQTLVKTAVFPYDKPTQSLGTTWLATFNDVRTLVAYAEAEKARDAVMLAAIQALSGGGVDAAVVIAAVEKARDEILAKLDEEVNGLRDERDELLARLAQVLQA